MRSWVPLTIAAASVLACGEDGETRDEASPCAAVLDVYQDALMEAMNQAPPCVTDADCTAMQEQAECESAQISLCQVAVHRVTAETFDSAAVGKRMCEVLDGGDYGCAVSASCAAPGPALCRAGACVFATR